jgi:lactate dehydrogenase-like 2-hydroxyacid dehydrogenase
LFSALSKAGGKAFSNMAVGYNNVDVNAANKYGVAVGNTPVSYPFSNLIKKIYEVSIFRKLQG